MTDYKLVPVEMALPCPFCGSSNIGNKYIETYSTDSSYDTFGCKDCRARFEDGCQDDWNRRAAPAVHGEPVAWGVSHADKGWEVYSAYPDWAEGDFDIVPLYTAPQPAEQHPDVSQLVEALERAHMALIGYLPGHRNDITDAAISQCEQVLAPYRKGDDA